MTMHTWFRCTIWKLSFWFATHHALTNFGFSVERNNHYAVRSLLYNGKRASWEVCWLLKNKEQ